eukprot:scaffold50862_cov65-Phaeocystis_antarctica.AAC.3
MPPLPCAVTPPHAPPPAPPLTALLHAALPARYPAISRGTTSSHHSAPPTPNCAGARTHL